MDESNELDDSLHNQLVLQPARFSSMVTDKGLQFKAGNTRSYRCLALWCWDGQTYGKHMSRQLVVPSTHRRLENEVPEGTVDQVCSRHFRNGEAEFVEERGGVAQSTAHTSTAGTSRMKQKAIAVVANGDAEQILTDFLKQHVHAMNLSTCELLARHYTYTLTSFFSESRASSQPVGTSREVPT